MKRPVTVSIAVAAIAAFATIVFALVKTNGNQSGYEFDLGPAWTKAPITNGYEFRSADAQVITVLSFVDPLMDQEVLFSRQTRNNIRENYEETYIVDDDRVYFSDIEISGRKALVVRFADRSSGTVVHKRQYYLVEGHEVYVITGIVTDTMSQAELDALAAKFHIL